MNFLGKGRADARAWAGACLARLEDRRKARSGGGKGRKEDQRGVRAMSETRGFILVRVRNHGIVRNVCA